MEFGIRCKNCEERKIVTEGTIGGKAEYVDRVKEGKRERERERNRQTGRQTDIHRYTQIDRQTDREVLKDV